MESKLSRIFYDLKSPAGLLSPRKLYIEAKKSIPNLTVDDVTRYLARQYPYTLHKQTRSRWKRNRVVADHVDAQWQADLVILDQYAKYNDGYKCLLTCVDVLSKYAFISPLPDKSGKSVLAALKEIFKIRRPTKLQTDKGKEFLNSAVQSFLKQTNISYFHTNNPDIKGSNIERFNRTIKTKMWKYFTVSGKYRYIDILPDIIRTYNNSMHSSIKMKPSEVTHVNEGKAFKNQYGFRTKREMLIERSKKNTKSKLLENDHVRRQEKPKTFEKAHWPGWTDQLYEVEKVNRDNIKPFIKLKGEKRRFYEHDLQKVDKDTEYRVEKIIKTRIRNGKREFLLKYTNLPSSQNTWEPIDNVRNLL